MINIVKEVNTIHYLDIGQGEPVILIHGLGSKKESWENQYELSSNYRLIIPDLRGHGESEEFDNISISVFAHDILSLLASLGIEKAHFCGLSMGGLVVQEIYCQNNKIVQSMVLSNTFSYAPTCLGQLTVMKGARNLHSSTSDEYTTYTAEKCLYRKETNLIDAAKKMFLIKKVPYLASSFSAIKSNYLPILPFVRVPTLIIGGQYDEVNPLFSVLQTKWFMPRAELVILGNCGHLPILEKKHEYNHLLNRFFHKYQVSAL
ncbi:alpha/beta fold hydrolase [Psychrobacillus lasiicapitis]|uniref:Alpha/beta hydrolase n=1 Tax=Psychrobacillus lasiicapitis TaxID=1636719 RepID=A0A544T6I7_9BACI|nr:alpha/beta hydrolase [Psychrobacillus lasiicapitis]